MAATSVFSHATIRRTWTAFGLQPHRAETFKLSCDPLFDDKVHDIIGLYITTGSGNCALPDILSMVPGVAERRTHTCVRAIRHRYSPCSTLPLDRDG